MAASHNFDSAYRALKRQAPAPAYYLTGDEELLKEELIEMIVGATVDNASREFNFDSRSAADLDGESLHALVETPPMLADRRVVVVKNIDQWRKNAKVWKVVHGYLESPSPSTVVIFTQGPGQAPDKTIAKRSTHVALEPLNHERQLKWIMVRAERAGFNLEEEAARHLLKAVGSDLSILATEIDKLAAIATEGEQLGVNAVAELAGVRRGETALDWIEAVLLRDTSRSVDVLDVVLSNSGISGVRLISTLGTALIGLRLARAMLDGGTTRGRVAGALRRTAQKARIGWMFRDWDDPFGLWARAAEIWQGAEIDLALRAAYECDKALKSTTVSDERGKITDVLLQMSRIEVAA